MHRFEDFIQPLLHRMTDEQVQDGVRWTPSKVIARLGQEINDERSIYYWAWKVRSLRADHGA